MDILIQVQSGDEDTKHGVSQDEVDNLIKVLNDDCPRLHFKGFMAMGKLGDREGFQQLNNLVKRIQPQYEHPLVLSMGTSMDFEMAIEEGATEVRLGSTIFGQRN